MFKDMHTFSFFFESLAIKDLKVNYSALDAELYSYRDESGREADALIQFRDGNWALIDVKLVDFENVDASARKLLKLSGDIHEHKEKPLFSLWLSQKMGWPIEGRMGSTSWR